MSFDVREPSTAAPSRSTHAATAAQIDSRTSEEDTALHVPAVTSQNSVNTAEASSGGALPNIPVVGADQVGRIGETTAAAGGTMTAAPFAAAADPVEIAPSGNGTAENDTAENDTAVVTDSRPAVEPSFGRSGGALETPFVTPRGTVPAAIDVDFAVPLRQQLRFTDDVLDGDVGILLDLLPPGGIAAPKVIVYCERAVAEAHAGRLETFQAKLSAAVDLVAPVQTLEGGEVCKNDTSVIDRLLGDINTHDLDRRSYVLVIGGGAVLDAVGYAAAVAHRGLRLVRLPTTTLAQDDSGVGVKNAVNWFEKKNWKGTFACPWAVVCDRGLLESLPNRDFRSGFSEAVKVSLLKDAAFFDEICRLADRIRRRDWEACSPVIRESAVWHLRHITRNGDPFEALEARPLDFGHWSAHRLEPLSNYAIRHGEAVSMGLAIDVAYSHLVHGLSADHRDAVIGCLQRLGIPVRHDLLGDTDQLLQGLEEFRQHLGGRLTITMLEAPGRPLDVHEIDAGAMREAIEFVAAFSEPVLP